MKELTFAQSNRACDRVALCVLRCTHSEAIERKRVRKASKRIKTRLTMIKVVDQIHGIEHDITYTWHAHHAAYDDRMTDVWQNNYGSSSSQQPYYQQPQPSQAVPLQFYQPQPGQDGFYAGSRPSLDGNVMPQGSISSQPTQSYGGNIQPAGSWLSAFGTGGFEGEPPLLEGVCAAPALGRPSPSPCLLELGINFSHIRSKSLAVLNPFERIDARIMDDADLAGPLIFFLCFATFLLFVRVFNLPSCSPPTLSCPVRKAPVQLHLWHCPIRLGVDLHPAEPDGRTGDRRIPSNVGTRILSSTYRWCRRPFCCRDS